MARALKLLLLAAGLVLGAAFFISYPADTTGEAASLPRSAAGEGIRIPDPDSAGMNFRTYIWPTDASRKITSSFAEFRTLHFHGGIDISTNGSVGHRVFAVEDGYLLRIRITPNGYGKMLYLKHPDGYVSTYAHLKAFDPEIEKLASAEQYRTGRYEIDLLYSSPVHRVRKGDVIAYTGDTGFGPPHLHFELRDGNLNPVNPLLGTAFRQEDRISPNIYRLLARPLSARSEVNDRPDPRVFSRFPRKNGAYRLPGKIRVRGEVGFAIGTVDRSNGVGGRKGVHRTDFVLDGDTIFQSELNAVPILKTKQIYLHYDLPMILGGKGRFQKLYVEPGNELPFYSHTGAGRGVIRAGELSEGEHAFSVFCTDIYGNRSELRGTIVAVHPPEIAVAGAGSGTVRVVASSGPSIDLISVMGKKQFASAWTEHTIREDAFRRSGDTITVPVNTDRYDMIKVRARTPAGSWSDPLFRTLRTEPGPAHKIFIDHEVVGDELKISVSTPGVFTTPPAVIVSEGLATKKVTMTPEDPSRSVGYFALRAAGSDPLTIGTFAAVNGHDVSSEASLRLFSIPADRAGGFTSSSPAFSVSYDSGAVFRPLHFTVSAREEQGRTVYSFDPQDVLLNGGIRISLPRKTGAEASRLRLYFRTNQGWNMLEPLPGTREGMVSGLLTTTLGEVAQMVDDTPPTLGLLRVRVSGGKPSVSFRYYDNLSGNDLDLSTMTIDDSLVIPEYDGEHRRARYNATGRLPRGRHLLRITLNDRVSNSSVTERWFNVR